MEVNHQRFLHVNLHQSEKKGNTYASNERHQVSCALIGKSDNQMRAIYIPSNEHHQVSCAKKGLYDETCMPRFLDHSP